MKRVSSAAINGNASGRSLVIRTPAKINLGLRVLSRRPDGYHEIRTVLASVDLWDTLTFEPGGDGLALECDTPSIPTDETNLVVRSALLLQEFVGRRLPGVRIRLQKNIPAGRGLGGGSSDAAAALVGLNRLFGLGLRRHALHRLLAAVGMDAPFFLYGGIAVATGRGEQVFPVSATAELPLVLLIPDFMIPTPDAYRGLPEPPASISPDGGYVRTDSLLRFLESGPSGPQLSGKLPVGCFPNDLERSTVLQTTRPPDAISRMRSTLKAAGAVETAMSGSGSAVFGVFPDRQRATLAASRLSRGNLRAIATRTISRSEHRAALFGRWPDGAWPRG